MFSKYSSIRVPQNYSGNRFKGGYDLPTETKTHSPSDNSAVKSSVSPVYQEQLDAYMGNESESEEEYSYIEEENDSYNDTSEANSEQEIPDPVDKNSQKECNQSDSCKVDGKHSAFDELLKKFNSEDLLLVCLIIFLSADAGIENNDIIILLSLLLAYHI